MKIQKILPLLAFAAVAARAEVKEPGEVVARQCGQVTRTTQVCLADVTDMNKVAIEITSHVPGPTDIPVSYTTRVGIVHKVKKIEAAGATTTEYVALIPYQEQDSYKIIFKEAVLRVVQVVRPGLDPRATLTINGEPQYGEFTLQDVVTTQSLE